MNRQELRVLHVIDCLALGGAERMLVELVNGLRSVMVEPSVCVTRQDLTLARTIHKGVLVHRLDRKYTWDMQAMKRFRRIVRDENIQILHAHGPSSFLFALFACLGLGRQVPIILHAHNSVPPNRLVCLFGRMFVDHFIGVSPQQLQWARQYMSLPENKISLLGNAIDLQPFQTANPQDLSSYFKVPPKHIGIITANVLPVKNFELLFRALTLSKYRSQIGLLVAGSTAQVSYFEKCQNWLLKLGLHDNVIFLDRREDIPELLVSADFGVLSSERETGPVAVLEYMAAGLPFVATSVGQITQEVAMAGLPGIVPSNDPIVFAEALDELVELSQKARTERIQKGSQLLVERFAICDRIADLEMIYRQLVRPGRI
jgi:glycosyltransferase involved in cell wall biosynthesis